MAEKPANLWEEALPREPLAISLYALAAAALLGCLATLALREQPVKRRYASSPVNVEGHIGAWPTHQGRTVATRERTAAPRIANQPLHEVIDQPLHGPSAEEIRTDLATILEMAKDYRQLANVPGEFVRRPSAGPTYASPFERDLTASLNRPVQAIFRQSKLIRSDEPKTSLAVLMPSKPLLAAGTKRTVTAPHGQMFGFDLSRAAIRLGRWWADKPTWISAVDASQWVPRIRVARERKVVEPIATPLGRQAGSRPRVVVGPGDRLAMVPARRSSSPPRLTIRRRDPDALILVAPKGRVATSPDNELRMDLSQLLEPLSGSQITAEWSARVNQKAAEASFSQGEFTQLSQLAAEAFQLAEAIRDAKLAADLRRAGHALERRIATWQLASEFFQRGSSVVTPAVGRGDAKLRSRLAEVLTATAETDRMAASRGEAWRQYLMVEQLSRTLKGRSAVSLADRRALASEIVSRLSVRALDAQQRDYVVSGPIAALGDELAEWAAPPLDTRALLARLEEYERDSSPRIASRIARDIRQLSDSSEALHRELAGQIEKHYRNANLRVALTAEMLERFLPPATSRVDPVSDTIAGELVRGRAATNTQLSLRLQTDPQAWRIGLEARGQVNSQTFSNPGPIVMQNHGATNFVGRKLISIERAGMKVSPATCDVSSRMRLTGMRSYYDDVPLLGSFVRSQASDEYAARKRLAKQQSDQRVRVRVQTQFDRQASPLLAKLRQDYSAKVLARTSRLGLDATPIELRTTDSRLIGRFRVANSQQLAAHTPRNRAPGDSLASLQIHQSVLNNGAEGLMLGGRRLTPQQLRELIQQKLELPLQQTKASSDPAAEQATLVFAEAEPIRIVLEEGQAELILSLAEFTFDRKRFRNFKVHAFYKPETDGMQARMVRDGGVQIEGRLRTAARIRLHGVFGQVLSEDRPITLLRPAVEQDPRVDGLMITQLVIGDGWLGLAIGPETATGRIAEVGRYIR